MDNFQNIPYTHLDNEENLSLYISATDKFKKDTKEDIPGYGLRNKLKRSTSLDNLYFLNRNKSNNSNKYVNEETLNSYLSITDLQNDANDNVNICRNNVKKVYERQFKIEDLEDTSNNLLDGSSRFNTTSKKLKRKMYIKYIANYILLVLFIILIVYLIVKLTSN